MRIMYQQANIIHHDLLEHTLWHKDHCYFIDFSHAIDADQVNASYILTKNCAKIVKVSEQNQKTFFFLKVLE